MIAVIRIKGRVKNKKKDEETLKRLKLKNKFNCILVDEKDKVRLGMVHSAKSLLTFGKVSDEILKELEKKKQKNSVIRLHPPRGGFKKSTKLAYPKGILGENPKINDILSRML